ncbi:hypothetical protein [Evansella tamaricis]|uniref:NADH dehydrogenase subunit 6 n=1 Tax=Evansella tamaricis TaxID=2069301 RepID=A0ABS6JIN9_9BACI|nr:hypothetical protein [Evansella tamaricis]MBU9713456.1 hypothetical protein [Evansella tamaricis]
MDGFWFYWFCWLMAILVYFFDDIKKRRDLNLSLVLILIISSILTFSIPFISIEVRASLVVFIVLSLKHFLESKKVQLFYHSIICMMVSGVFLGVHYFIYFEPVWLYVSPLMMISCGSLVVVLLLVKQFMYRISVMIFGALQGEVLLTLFLWNDAHPTLDYIIVGDFYFLDILSISLLMIVMWEGIERLSERLKAKWNQGNILPPTRKRKLNA